MRSVASIAVALWSATVHAAGQSTTVSVMMGSDHTCAVLYGRLACWGRGNKGQLGFGNTDTVGKDEVPVDYSPGNGADNFVDFSHASLGTTTVQMACAGSQFTCALMLSGNVTCFGRDSNGQLGQPGTFTAPAPQPIALPESEGSRAAQSIACGYEHACALMSGGDISCWGDNSEGQLGYPTVTQLTEPGDLVSLPTVDGSNKVKSVHAGKYFTCAVMHNNQMVCWGRNGEGQLGRGDTADGSGPPAGVRRRDTLLRPAGGIRSP